jgi:hypothetical protein
MVTIDERNKIGELKMDWKTCANKKRAKRIKFGIF